MKNETLKLSSPTMTFFHEVEELFRNDDDVTVKFIDNFETQTIKIYVVGDEKASALSQLLPTTKTFGNIVVNIQVIPANLFKEPMIDLFEKAFKGNGAFSYIHKPDNIFDFNYVVFSNKVVQFFNDDLSDVNGYKSTLYQDIAKDVFDNHDGIFFCTELRT